MTRKIEYGSPIWTLMRDVSTPVYRAQLLAWAGAPGTKADLERSIRAHLRDAYAVLAREFAPGDTNDGEDQATTLR